MIRRAPLFVLGLILLAGSNLAAQGRRPGLTMPPEQQFAETDSAEQREVEKVFPWTYRLNTGYRALANDSVLRWQIWPNWGEKFAYRHDVISSRQGSNGRIDAYQISGFGSYEQQLYVDGINMANPITGLINYNLVPSNKVGYESEHFGDVYTSNIRLKEYYLTEPLSYLNYDEAKNNFRNLEFMIAQNFNERTQAEVSFWDRRDGGNFRRNEVVGSQIMFKGYHYLKPNLQIRTTLIRSAYEREESFGYNIPNPETFTFSQYSAGANQSSALADVKRRDFIIGVYSRDDSSSAEKAGVAFSQNKNTFDLPFSTDTLNWDISTYSLSGFRWFEGNQWRLKAQTNADYNKAKTARNFSENAWLLSSVKADFELDLTQKLSVLVLASTQQRNTGHQAFAVTAGLNIHPSPKSNLVFRVSKASSMPSIQQLYWASAKYLGNANLKNKENVSIYAKANQHLGLFEVGVSGRYQLLNNDFFVSPDTSFVNSSDYSVLSGTVFAKFQNHRWELESSATTHALTSEIPTSVLELNNLPDQKIWVRNNVFVRGYVFERAAYLRAGIRTTLSPMPYRSAYFNTELQYWENSSVDESEIPAYFRMDAELSARVRGIMVLLRWENTLDGIGQLGYFETATYPMPGRRLIMGIRAQFRN